MAIGGSTAGRVGATRMRALVGTLLLLVAGLLVVGAGVAKAAPADGCGTPQARVDRALASLHFPWRSLHYRYVAKAPRADGLFALTWTGSIRRTEVYVQSCGTEDDALLRHVVAHEVGHAIDDAWGTKKERKGWLKARGLASSTRWYACDGCPVWATGEGDFVEVFSLWQTGQFHSDLAPPPSQAQLPKLVKLIPRHKPATRPVGGVVTAVTDPGPGTITVTGSAPAAPPPSYSYPPEPTPAPSPPPSESPSPAPTPAKTCVYYFVFPVCS